MIEPHTFEWRWTHNGLVLPWFTKPCLEWLVRQDLSEKTVLEWGIGLDIPWWCRAAKRFIGIEHDPGTGKDHENAKPPANGILCYVGTESNSEDDADTGALYVQAGAAMARHWAADLIVIDGIYRVGCARRLAVVELSARTRDDEPLPTIIVDNAEWPGLRVVRELFENDGRYQRTSFVQPDHSGGWTTDVWERR